MKKKALVLGLAAALTLSQAAMAIAAGSITVSGGSGGSSGGGGGKSDLTSGNTVVVNSETGQVSSTGTGTTTTASQDTVNAPLLSVAGGPATGAAAVAAPQVTQDEVAQKTAGLAGYATSVTANYSEYAAGAANAIRAVNANPAALATLPSAEDLSQYVMLTSFQEVNVADAQGISVAPSAGQCVSISVPALMPGMQVYLLYVDPLTCMTVKVQAAGVDYANQQVLVDASVPGAFTIVYSR